MHIQESGSDGVESIKNLHLLAFGNPEGQMVSDLTANLLNENSSVEIISLVALEDKEDEENKDIIGHVIFSPVFLEKTKDHFAYILAPLGVTPELQKHGIGSSLVRHGLDVISKLGSFIVFVYGDPDYYSRFGFTTDFANDYIPPYPLQFPEGWQALKSGSATFPEGGTIRCMDSLNNPELW